MITPQEARTALEAYVSENRPSCRVSEILEDRTDYYAVVTSRRRQPIGETFTFLRKSDGLIWHGIPIEVFEKLDGMKSISQKQ